MSNDIPLKVLGQRYSVFCYKCGWLARNVTHEEMLATVRAHDGTHKIWAYPLDDKGNNTEGIINV